MPDYKTLGISRNKLKELAKVIRKIFRCRNKYYFDVVKAFEIMPQLFKDYKVKCLVVEDEELPSNVPACCEFDSDDGGYIIKVKNTVYEGACKRKIGGYRAHICHEISHVILMIFGFKPILNRIYQEKELRPYESVEWQAKALCGYILVDPDNCKKLSEKQIEAKCKVSKDLAATMFNLINADKSK